MNEQLDDLRGLRVRFAPSPTGYLHIGGARTALFNYLLARRHGGTFVLRMEDTDQRRNTPEARQAIFDGLRWLGLGPDEGPEEGGPFGPYSQSERGEIYAQTIAQLEESAAIYPCFCTRERLSELRERQQKEGASRAYDQRCRPIPAQEARARIAAGEEHTWRLRVPPGETSYDDLILGPAKVLNCDIEDIILVRANGEPVYNLVVVIDDHHMRISHVIRGQDHQTNTFKQILIYRALGWELPRFGHMSLILAEPPHKGKMSKRHGGARVAEYRQAGYHVEAMINWLALMGWSYDDKTELMSRSELIERFDLARVGKSGAQLNRSKLEWLSGEYIRATPIEELIEPIRKRLVGAGFLTSEQAGAQRERLRLIATCLRPRICKFADVVEQCRWIFTSPPTLEAKAERNLLKDPEAPQRLERLAAELPDPLAPIEELEAWARAFAEREGVGFGKLVHPVRAALTGSAQGPGLFHCFHILGREESIARLREGARRAREKSIKT